MPGQPLGRGVIDAEPCPLDPRSLCWCRPLLVERPPVAPVAVLHQEVPARLQLLERPALRPKRLPFRAPTCRRRVASTLRDPLTQLAGSGVPSPHRRTRAETSPRVILAPPRLNEHHAPIRRKARLRCRRVPVAELLLERLGVGLLGVLTGSSSKNRCAPRPEPPDTPRPLYSPGSSREPARSTWKLSAAALLFDSVTPGNTF